VPALVAKIARLWLMLWSARQLLGQFLRVVNEHISAHPGNLCVPQKNEQRRLQLPVLIIGDVHSGKRLFKAEPLEHLVLRQPESLTDPQELFV
jgi:hypothetical protein